MAKEIERKFLVDLNKIALANNGDKIEQGYIATASNTAVRIRIKGKKAYLTLKGENKGATRSEFEYPIPVADAEQILQELCQKPFVAKTRYEIPLGQHTWELDIFHGENEGLVVAEIELGTEDEAFTKPDWVAEEVTGEVQFYNSSLLKHPYKDWEK